MVKALAIGPKVRGIKTSRERWIFKDDKNPYHAFLRSGVKLSVPLS
jgi:hypothetical protein